MEFGGDFGVSGEDEGGVGVADEDAEEEDGDGGVDACWFGRSRVVLGGFDVFV